MGGLLSCFPSWVFPFSRRAKHNKDLEEQLSPDSRKIDLEGQVVDKGSKVKIASKTCITAAPAASEGPAASTLQPVVVEQQELGHSAVPVVFPPLDRTSVPLGSGLQQIAPTTPPTPATPAREGVLRSAVCPTHGSSRGTWN